MADSQPLGNVMETLAQGSTVFRMPPQDWKRIWLKSMLAYTAVIIAAIGSISLIMVLFAENLAPLWGMLALAIVGVLIMAPIAVFTSRHQVAKLASQRYEVTETSFIHHDKDREVRIELDEIDEIADNPLLGIILTAKNPQRLVMIPRGIANKAEFKARLSAVKPVQEVGAKVVVLPLYLLGVFLLIGLMLAPQLWLSIPAVLLLGGLAIRETVTMIRMKTFSKQEKLSGFMILGFFWLFVLLGVLITMAKLFPSSFCVCP